MVWRQQVQQNLSTSVTHIFSSIFYQISCFILMYTAIILQLITDNCNNALKFNIRIIGNSVEVIIILLFSRTTSSELSNLSSICVLARYDISCYCLIKYYISADNSFDSSPIPRYYKQASRCISEHSMRCPIRLPVFSPVLMR